MVLNMQAVIGPFCSLSQAVYKLLPVESTPRQKKNTYLALSATIRPHQTAFALKPMNNYELKHSYMMTVTILLLDAPMTYSSLGYGSPTLTFNVQR